MKVLVVDDNVAIREIIAEILSVDGHEIEHAATLEDAQKEIEVYKPDLMILDSFVSGKNTIAFVDSLDKTLKLKIIIISGIREQIPRDSPLIFSVVKKPFKSSDILEAVRPLSSNHILKPKIEPTKKIFGRGKEEALTNEEKRNVVIFGKSYVVFEDTPKQVYNITQKLIKQGGDPLFLTFEKTKVVADKVETDGTKEGCKYLSLSLREKADSVHVKKLGTMMHNIITHIDINARPVIVFDDLTRVLDNTRLNDVLTLIYQIFTHAPKKFTMIISVKESMLTEKDKALIYNHMGLYKQYVEEMNEYNTISE